MKLSLLFQSLEDLGAEVLHFHRDGAVYSLDFFEPAAKSCEVPALTKAEESSEPCYSDLLKDNFDYIREKVNSGEGKSICVGDLFTIPHLKVPAVNCEGEEFDEIDLKDVVIRIVHVEPRRVVFNFEDILFRHDIDYEESGKPFEETPLGVYLAKHFSDALKEHIGKVKATLLTLDNVFNEESKDFMPYFKPIKNRIKVLAFENDTWWWWLKTPTASNATYFCGVDYNGNSNYGGASDADGGVSPAFEFTADSE